MSPSHDSAKSSANVANWSPTVSQRPQRPFSEAEAAAQASAQHSVAPSTQFAAKGFGPAVARASAAAPAEIQAKEEKQLERPGFDFSKVSLFAGGNTPPPTGAGVSGGLPSLQAKSMVQRQPESEGPEEDEQAPAEEIQRKCETCGGDEDGDESSGGDAPDGIQTKLTIGQPGDKYEQEADQMAARVVSMPEPAVQRQAEGEADELEDAPATRPGVQMKGGAGTASADFEQRLGSTKGSGAPLGEDVRGFMEPRFGADFSQVRVHTGSEAVQLNKEVGAQAFTHGNDLYFNAGKYSPDSAAGKELLAHELTHTIQQGKSKIQSETNANALVPDKTSQLTETPRFVQAKPSNSSDESGKYLKKDNFTALDQTEQPDKNTPSDTDIEKVGKFDRLENIDADVSDAVQDFEKENDQVNLEVDGEKTKQSASDSSAVEPEADITDEETAQATDFPEETSGSASTGHLDAATDPVDELQPEGVAPDNEAQTQIPDSELLNLSEATLTSPEILVPPPLPDSPELAEVAQQVLQSSETEKTALRQAIAVERQQISAETEVKTQAVLADTQTKVQALTASISAKQAEIKQSFTTAKAAVKVNITSQKAAAQADATKALISLKQEVVIKRKVAISSAKEQAEKIQQSGTEEANRATASATESSQRIQAAAAQQAGHYAGKPKVQKAVRKAVQTAAYKAINKIQKRNQKLSKDAKSASSKTSHKFISAGTKFAFELGKGQDQVEKSIKQVTTSTINSITAQEQQQLKQLSTLNTKTNSSLSQLKGKATIGIKKAGKSAAQGIRKAGKAALNQLEKTEAASVGQLDKESYQIVNRLQQIPQGGQFNKDSLQEFKQLTKGGLKQAKVKLGTTIKEKSSAFKSGLEQAKQASTNKLGEAQNKISVQINQTVTPIKSGLAQAPTEATKTTQQVVKINKETNQDAIQKFSSGLQGEIDKAKQTWSKERENVNQDIKNKVNEGIKGNKDAASNAKIDLSKVAQEAATKAESSIWRGIWNGILNVLGVLLLFAALTLVVFAVGLLLVKWGIISGITLLAAAAIVGIGFLIYGLVTSGIHRIQELIVFLHSDAPWYRKALAVFNVPGAIVADVFGVGAILEGTFNQSILTGEDLNLTPEQQAQKITEGVLSVALIFLFAKIANRSAGKPRTAGGGKGSKSGNLETPKTETPKTETPKTETPKTETPKTETPKTETPKTETPKTETPKTETPKAETPKAETPKAGKYDPKSRTFEELKTDTDTNPRTGETPVEAVERARLADAELTRRATERYSGLGEEPPHVDMVANDAAHPRAHTLERHGSDVAMERSLDPSGLPDGIRTIEGRVYGDPPWHGKQSFSAKWLNQSILGKVINRYIKAHWETIRADLAIDGNHSASFDAGFVVGKGYYNLNYGKPGAPIARGPVPTTMVYIAIEFIPGNPPSFYIVTTYPSLRGF